MITAQFKNKYIIVVTPKLIIKLEQMRGNYLSLLLVFKLLFIFTNKAYQKRYILSNICSYFLTKLVQFYIQILLNTCMLVRKHIVWYNLLYHRIKITKI